MSVAKVKEQIITDNFALYNGDSIEVTKDIPKESIGLCIHSPPFASLYAYSDDDRDLGNCKDYSEFFKHYGFLVEQLQRVMMTGRIVAVHCMDMPTFKNKGEEIGIRDFPGDIIRLFEKHGFIYHSRHCIWKDPLVAATRTKAIGLAHKQIVKDSSLCRMGIPDYLLAFRKKGENKHPIKHPNGLTEYSGSEPIPRHLERFINSEDNSKNKRSHWIWQRYASPVWMDIRQTRVLQFKSAKDKDDQRHICPLQTDTVERCLVLWSNPNDVVLDPFAGIGTTVYEAVRMKRKGIGIELKASYFKQMKKNMEILKHAQRSKVGFWG